MLYYVYNMKIIIYLLFHYDSKYDNKSKVIQRYKNLIKFLRNFAHKGLKRIECYKDISALFLSRIWEFICRKAAWLAIRIVYTATSISSIDSCENFPQTTVCYRNIVRAIDIEYYHNATIIFYDNLLTRNVSKHSCAISQLFVE